MLCAPVTGSTRITAALVKSTTINWPTESITTAAGLMKNPPALISVC